MLAAADVATALVEDALAPWSTGTSLVNFAGHAGESARGGAWTPDALQRLRRVKQAVDPSDVFWGGLMPSATVPAGVR